jgi:hypothetical protein
VAVILVIVLNFLLSAGLVPEMEHPPSLAVPKPPIQQQQQQHPLVLKQPTPIFVVGLPKAGTSSIHAMFECSGVKSSHYCCCGSNRTHTHCNDGGRTFGECMRENIKAKRPILGGCGNYSVYAQMDSELGNSTFQSGGEKGDAFIIYKKLHSCWF